MHMSHRLSRTNGAYGIASRIGYSTVYNYSHVQYMFVAECAACDFAF
jgi:hypothetical protein